MNFAAVGDNSIVQAVRRWITRNSVPLSVFAVGRAGLYFLAYFSLIFLPTNLRYQDYHRYPQNLFVDAWLRWDSGWYGDIADQGYTNIPRDEQGRTDLNFFPLYPLTIRAVKTIVGNTFLSGWLISNVAFLIALILLFRLISNHYDAEVAQRSLVLLSVYPFSYCFSAMYTESLFLLAVVCAFYFGERKQWIWAALSAAAAGATRVVGTMTALGLVVLFLEQIDFDWRRIRPNILWILLSLLGLGSHMAFLTIRFGDPLQFVKSRYNWGYEGIGTAWATIHASLSLQSILAGRYPALRVINLSIFLIALVLCVLAWRRPRIAYAVWGILILSASFSNWKGMGRYAAVVFPMYIVASLRLSEERWYQIVVYISTLMLALFTIMYTHYYMV